MGERCNMYAVPLLFFYAKIDLTRTSYFSK